MIPPVLHVVWLGDEADIPRMCLDSWRRADPELEIRLWGSDETSSVSWSNHDHMTDVISDEGIPLQDRLAAVSDLMRYEILRDHGGISVPIFSVAYRPFPRWLLEVPAFATWADELDETGVISGRLMGATPGSEFFERLVEDIHAGGPLTQAPLRQTTGEYRLTSTWKNARSPLVVYPSHFFPDGRTDAPSPVFENIVIGENLVSSSSWPTSESHDSVDVVMEDPVGREAFVAWPVQPERFRVVVATDWSSATLPFAALQAFSKVIDPGAPVDLVFAVPEDVSETDLAAVSALCEGLGDGTQLSGLGLESFAEASGRHAYAAIVPTGDPDAAIMELSEFVVNLHHLSVRLSADVGDETVPTSSGYNAGLARRFDAFGGASKVVTL